MHYSLIQQGAGRTSVAPPAGPRDSRVTCGNAGPAGAWHPNDPRPREVPGGRGHGAAGAAAGDDVTAGAAVAAGAGRWRSRSEARQARVRMVRTSSAALPLHRAR